MSDTVQHELPRVRILSVCLPLPPPWDWPVLCPRSQNTAWAWRESAQEEFAELNGKERSDAWSWQTPLSPH